MKLNQWPNPKNGKTNPANGTANHTVFGGFYELKPGHSGEIGQIYFVLDSLKTKKIDGRMTEFATIRIHRKEDKKEFTTICLEKNAHMAVKKKANTHFWEPLQQAHDEGYRFTCTELDMENNTARFKVESEELKIPFLRAMLP